MYNRPEVQTQNGHLTDEKIPVKMIWYNSFLKQGPFNRVYRLFILREVMKIASLFLLQKA